MDKYLQALTRRSLVLFSGKRCSRPVTSEQISEAVMTWMIRFPGGAPKSPEEGALIAAEYHEELLDAGVSEHEFHLLKKIVNRTSTFFPKMVDLLEARMEFAQHVHTPTAADREALVLNPGYKHGKPFVEWKPEVLELLEQDYEEIPEIEHNPVRKLIGGIG